MELFEFENLTVDDGAEGDVLIEIEGRDYIYPVYLPRIEAIRLRDWLTEFLP